MSFQDIFEDDEWNERLKPRVVIAANDVERFKKTADLIAKNGISCHVVSDSVQLMAEAGKGSGTIVFVSWNLKNADVKAIVKAVTEGLKTECIAFAEDDGIKTRSELAASHIKEKIQAPFSDRNFLLAVQSIIKNRIKDRKAFERKQRIQEKMKTAQKSTEERRARDLPTLIDSQQRSESDGVSDIHIIKTKNNKDETYRFKGEKRNLNGASTIQKGFQGNEHQSTQSGDNASGVNSVQHTSHSKPLKTAQSEGNTKAKRVARSTEPMTDPHKVPGSQSTSPSKMTQTSNSITIKDSEQTSSISNSTAETLTKNPSEHNTHLKIIATTGDGSTMIVDRSKETKKKFPISESTSLDKSLAESSVPNESIREEKSEPLKNMDVEAHKDTHLQPGEEQKPQFYFGPKATLWLLAGVIIASICLIIALYLLIFERYNIFKL